MNLRKFNKGFTHYFVFLLFFISFSYCFGQEKSDTLKITKFDIPVESVCWSPDGSFYITTNGNKLLFWNSITDSVVMEKSDYDASILTAKISDNGSSIVTVYNDNTFVVDGLKGNKYHFQQEGNGNIPVFDAVFYDNYYSLLVPLDGKNIYSFFCLLATNESIVEESISLDSGYVYGLDISKDSSKLLITDSYGKTILFDLKKNKELEKINGYSQVSLASRFNNKGDYFLYSYDENTIKIQSVYNSSETFVITDYDKPVNTADFSPDGKSLAVADARGFVKIFNIENGFVEDVYKLDKGDAAFSCEFSPDGKYLLIGTLDGNVIKWMPKYQENYKTLLASAGSGAGENSKGETGNNTDNDVKDVKDGGNEVMFVSNGDGSQGHANIFNTSVKSKKIADLGMHNIFAGAGIGTINSKNFWGNLKIKAGYHNFQLYPFYWGAGIGVDVGFTSRDFHYEYKVNGKKALPPVMLGIAPFGKFGVHYLFDKIKLLTFAELCIGGNIRMITLSGYAGAPTASFFTDIGLGVQWNFLRAEFDVQIDTNFIYSVNGTIGCSFRINTGKKKVKGKK